MKMPLLLLGILLAFPKSLWADGACASGPDLPWSEGRIQLVRSGQTAKADVFVTGTYGTFQFSRESDSWNQVASPSRVPSATSSPPYEKISSDYRDGGERHFTLSKDLAFDFNYRSLPGFGEPTRPLISVIQGAEKFDVEIATYGDIEVSTFLQDPMTPRLIYFNAINSCDECWCGSLKGQGLIEVDLKTRRSRIMSEMAPGLSSNVILSILKSDSEFWLATRFGVCQVDAASKARRCWNIRKALPSEGAKVFMAESLSSPNYWEMLGAKAKSKTPVRGMASGHLLVDLEIPGKAFMALRRMELPIRESSFKNSIAKGAILRTTEFWDVLFQPPKYLPTKDCEKPGDFCGVEILEGYIPFESVSLVMERI